MENQKIEANNGERQPALSPATCSAAWVSVDDALPPWKEYVLAYMPWNGGDRYMIARRLPSRAKNQEWQESSFGCAYRYGVQKRGHGQSITHWMTLTPPNVEINHGGD
jgi:hypothetical protein